MAEVKPYTISKQVVWEAYQKVKANKGGRGGRSVHRGLRVRLEE